MEEFLFKSLPGIGKSIRQSRRELLSASHSRNHVIVAGEVGTGKDHVARIIHNLRSSSGAEFLSVNLSTCTEWKRLSWQDTNCGTIYLDHCESVKPEEFSRVRKFINSMPARAHLIFSLTTKSKEDMSYALPLFNVDGRHSLVCLPALRSRKEDIPLIVAYLNRQYAPGSCLALGPEDFDYLYHHDWPRNLTELCEWVINRAVAGERAGIGRASTRKSLSGDFLEQEIDSWVEAMIGTARKGKGILKKITAHVERCVMRSVLERTNGNKSKTASILEIHRNTLAQKITCHKIASPGEKKRRVKGKEKQVHNPE